MGREIVIGFDLDMTLIDTVPGFVATLDALGAELGVAFPSAEMSSKLGPPLEMILEPYLAADAIAAAGDRFRALYPAHAVPPTPTLPGVVEALAAVRAHHGRVVLVTGKFPANARLHVEHLALDVDVVEGWVWGAAKGAVLAEHGATAYVGDHVHDVEGARAGGVVSVSVLTGGCTRAELEAAGTDVVLDDLTAFPQWLDEHVLRTRLGWLAEDLRGRGRILVAFSGGADSAFLLAAAVRAVGPENVAAATAYSPALPAAERDPARAFAESLGVRVLTPETHELDRGGYVANDGDRCAFCKSELLDVLTPLARRHGYDVVATGTNADDARAGFRPGIAAASERGAVTPLLDAGLSKAQVREASRRWGLPTWDKPAAACLSSRIAYGVEITPARLARVEHAEAAVRSLLGARGFVVGDLRVRDLGDTARVELDRTVLDQADEALLSVVREAGFAAVEVDPLGFRSGSMNELLPDPERFR
ncbi:ATP-dependent sacrificial sulfur transferase LarE [Marmoricola sp. RAF53]|uniref:ATP-dependent sacrificial sulfur transferase LarE n=1 Tax=Marmoricola sp. RAF53 TaxID=3233059 RepID=UPI003F94443C